MSLGQISLISAIVALALYLDWLIIKWLQKKRKSSTKIQIASDQSKNFHIFSLFNIVKQKIILQISGWKNKNAFVLDDGKENSRQRFSQNGNLDEGLGIIGLPGYRTTLQIIGFILSITLTIMGIIFMRRQELSTGLTLLVIALPHFLLVVRSLERKPPNDEDFTKLEPYRLAGLWLLITTGLTTALILNVTDYARTSQLDHAATVEWVLSVLFLTIGILAAARWKPSSFQDIWEWVKINRIEFGLAAAIIIFSLTFRIAALTEHPFPWSGDEASVGIDAVRILNGEITYLFDTGWSGQPNVSFLPTALSISIFGRTMFAIKMVSVLTGVLSILALYLLAREWFGSEIALIASGFLVAYPFHLQFSRIGVDNIMDSLMAPLVIWLIFRAVRLKSLSAYLIAGIASGLTLYTYVGTRLVLAMSIGTIIYIAIKQKGYLRASLPQLGSYLAGLVVTAAPITTFFIKRPDLFMTRLGQESIFLNGWLASEVAQTGQTVWQILLSQFARTTLVFFAQNTGANFLNFDRPYLTVLGALFFLIGLALSLRHFFDQRYFILQMWFWAVLALGGFLTASPPANTRLLMTIPVTALFIALGIRQVTKFLESLKIKRAWVDGIKFVLIVTLACQNLFFYFGTYRQERYFQDANGELGMKTGLQLQKLGESYDFYLFGVPRVVADCPTTVFLAPNNLKYDVDAESISQLALNPKRGAYFVAIPDNKELLQQIMKKYPFGSFETITGELETEVLYYAYTLHPKVTGSR